METACNLFYKNLREACKIYVREEYAELKAISTPVEFSEDFRIKMNKLLNILSVNSGKMRSENHRIYFMHALRRVAIMLILTIAFSLAITMAVEATRASFLEALTEFFDDHIRISSVNMDPDKANGPRSEPEGDLDKYVKKLETLGFEVEKHEFSANSGKVEYYVLERENKVILDKVSLENHLVGTVHDSEDSLVVNINGEKIYETKADKSWYWFSDSCEYRFTSYLEREKDIELLKLLLSE